MPGVCVQAWLVGMVLLRGATMASQRRTANPLVRGFTLTELLVVIGIILAVSVIALPTVLGSLKDRQVSEAARLLHAAIYGARDAAQNAGSTRDFDRRRSGRVPIGLAGLRFLPDPSIGIARLPSGQIDPTKALACDRWVQTEIPTQYTIGLASIRTGADYSGITPLPCLVLEEQPGHWEPSGTGYAWTIDEPTNWWNTIRLGEQVKIKGHKFTVCGPMAAFNPETLVNAQTQLTRVYTAPDGTKQTANPQYLFLVNGQDDNHDGFADSGWDGLDNNGDGTIDEFFEWEIETWPPALVGRHEDLSYAIVRRPVPSPNQTVTALPSSVAIDLTTWSTTGERSHLPVNPYTGTVDLIVEPNGTVRADLPYGVRTSQGMMSSMYHFWLTDRSSVADPIVTQGSFLTLPIPPTLAGSRYLVQVQARTGLVTTGPLESFADPAVPRSTDPLVPFLEYRQGN